MLKKTEPGWSFFFPLLLHSTVHGALTLFICLIWNPELWWLCIFDFAVHFTMDRVKAAPMYLGRFNDPSRKSFWVCFGFDQMTHHLTHYYIIWRLYQSF